MFPVVVGPHLGHTGAQMHHSGFTVVISRSAGHGQIININIGAKYLNLFDILIK